MGALDSNDFYFHQSISFWRGVHKQVDISEYSTGVAFYRILFIL